MNEKTTRKIKKERRFMVGRVYTARRILNIGRFRFIVTDQIGFMVSWGSKSLSSPSRHHIAFHIPFLSLYIS